MNSASKPLPAAKTVSVVVLCRNEQKHVARCLDSLVANDYDHRLLEIIVVDGMSTDGTRPIVAEYCRKYPWIRMVDNLRKIIPAGLNVGVREARTDVIVRIDAHAVYPPNYISGLAAGLDRYEADVIGPLLQIDEGRTVWERAVALIWKHPFAAGNAVHRTVARDSEPRPTRSLFPACFRRSAFERVGLFNERLVRAEDREFYERVLRAGGKVLVDPSVHCTYFPRTALRNYLRYGFLNGFWLYYARRFTDIRLASLRNLVPPLFVLWHLLAIVCGWLWPAMWPLAVAPIAAYWVLNVVVSARAAWSRRSWLLFPCLLLLFPATHYPNGAGCLWGWLTATLRGKRILSPVRIESRGPDILVPMSDGTSASGAMPSRRVGKYTKEPGDPTAAIPPAQGDTPC